MNRRKTTMRFHTIQKAVQVIAAGSVTALLAMGCATAPGSGDEFALDETSAEENAPLGGEALLQKKSEMQRSLGDLMHFHKTLSSLAQRDDSTGFTNFAGFLNPAGGAFPRITVAPGSTAGAIGTTVHHVLGVIDGGGNLDLVSAPLALTIVP